MPHPSVETKEQGVISRQKDILYYLRFSGISIKNGAVHYRLEHKILLGQRWSCHIHLSCRGSLSV